MKNWPEEILIPFNILNNLADKKRYEITRINLNFLLETLSFQIYKEDLITIKLVNSDVEPFQWDIHLEKDGREMNNYFLDVKENDLEKKLEWIIKEIEEGRLN